MRKVELEQQKREYLVIDLTLYKKEWPAHKNFLTEMLCFYHIAVQGRW